MLEMNYTVWAFIKIQSLTLDTQVVTITVFHTVKRFFFKKDEETVGEKNPIDRLGGGCLTLASA